jgi:hypothetical protein
MAKEQLDTIKSFARKFRDKVHAGTAKSVETYDDMGRTIALCNSLQEENNEDQMTILKLISTIRYMVGIAEKGLNTKCPETIPPEQYLLKYVKLLEDQSGMTSLMKERDAQINKASSTA